ncbi:hypothetical protein [Leptospira sp. P2653]|uniref:hypothetical protein n=1 Tax=Leptospira sp. P2653 TaxID=1218600 RepID=UPI000565BE84|nr:hypothetical protein [Leptospira sp. P2653]
MRLFTCKKYDFLIEKNLPSLSASRLNDLLPTGRSSPSTKNQGGADRFTEDLSEFRQIYFKIQALVGKVMASLWIG